LRKPPRNPLTDTPAPNYKSKKRQWEHERVMEDWVERHPPLGPIHEMAVTPSRVPPPGSSAEVADNVERALALPAAHLPIFKAASLDKLAEKIRENMGAEVDVAELLKEFPDMEPKDVIEIAKLYTERQARALEVGNRLVTSLIKAQKQMPNNQINVAISTGDVLMNGAPKQGPLPR